MSKLLFIPSKLKIGTIDSLSVETGKLAHLSYYNDKGLLASKRQFDSRFFQGGRLNPTASFVDIDNNPREGFYLSKGRGVDDNRYSSIHYEVLVYDPIGFEFVISTYNLHYLAMNGVIQKDGNLAGKFCYSWMNDVLVLVPESAPDYQESKALSKIIDSGNFIKAKDLVVGATYLDTSQNQYIYMGRHDVYERSGDKKKNKYHYFGHANPKSEYHERDFKMHSTISKKFVAVVTETPPNNFEEIKEKMESKAYFSPIDKSKTEYFRYTEDQVLESLASNRGRLGGVFDELENQMLVYEVQKGTTISFSVTYYNRTTVYKSGGNYDTIKELMSNHKLFWQDKYLANGKLYLSTKGI